MSNPAGRSVALLTLGCARNEVDSEELAARLSGDGWRVSTDVEGADVVLVNTCGFVEAAKRESVDTLLAAADTGVKVVATGCLAERYGRDLAKSLPEADAVLGFDHYPDISARLSAVLAGARVDAHAPRDRRTLLPLAPAARRTPGAVVVDSHTPAHLRPVLRRRLTTGPAAPLKLASGCDRRCSFCAIPSFRGAFVSRTPDELLAEAHWLAGEGVRELVLVSENSTSYGKDLGDPRLLEKLLPQLAGVAGIARIRVSYLQPAETRPSLVEALATTPGVAAYFDLSFQHASEPVLRRMRRFGSTGRFLRLLESVRALAPDAGARSNVIVGFPGETRADTIRRRYERLVALAEELCAQRAAQRLGSTVEVLVDTVGDAAAGGRVEGRAAHQAPEIDGSTTLVAGGLDLAWLRPGDLVAATVIGTEGVDLVAVPSRLLSAASAP